MKKLFGFIAVAMLGSALAFTAPAPVSAAEASATKNACKVETIGTQNGAGSANSKFTITNNQASIKFKVVGGDNCKPTVALKSWYSPSESGKPHADQKLFKEVTRTVGPGQHQMTVDLPAKGCFYQVDFVRVTSGAGNNEMLGFVLDGKKNCIQTPQTPTTPTTPQTPTSSTPAQTAAAAPATIAKTGPEAIIAQLFGASSLATSAAYYWQSRRGRS